MLCAVMDMIQECRDEFKHFQLPFQTFFNVCTTHDEAVHDELEFIWLFEGEISIMCNQKSFKLTPNHVFMFYIGQKHAMTSSGNTVSIAFRLNGDYINEKKLNFEKIPFESRVYTFEELANKYHEVPLIMSQLILLMKSKTLDTNIRYRLIGYYNMYLHNLYSVRRKERYLDIKKKNYDQYLLRYYSINEYIRKNYHKKIELKPLADLVGISTFRLSHFMHEILGVSLQEYISNIRVDRALLLLRNTSIPISEIVIQCGFSDQKYLNNEVKKRFHVTASTYRKIMLDNLHFGIPGFNFSHMIKELSYQLHRIQDEAFVLDTFGLKQNIHDTMTHLK
jgi:AraC-like DNA-binding protein